MVDVVKHRIFAAGIIAFLFFFPFYLALDNRDLFALCASLVIVNSLLTAHAYFPGMYSSWYLRKNELEYVDFLTVGVVVTWTAIAFWATFNLYVRQVTNYYPPIYTTVWLSFAHYCVFCGAIFHLSARRVIRDKAPSVSWPRIAWGIAGGAAMGTGICFFN